MQIRTLQTEISDALVEFEGIISFTDVDFSLTIASGTNTIEQLCAIIESSAPFYGAPIPADALDQVLSSLLVGDPDADVPALDALIECLVEAGVIVDRELPGSISDNPITTQSNNPITIQSNNPITIQSNNPITTTTTTQSSNIGGVPQSGNIGPSNLFFVPIFAISKYTPRVIQTNKLFFIVLWLIIN